VVAALVALAALFGGDFDETDGEILATLGLAILAGGDALAGLGLHEQRKARPLGGVLLVAAPVCFLIVAAYIWRGFEGDLARWAGTGLIVLIASGIISSSLLLRRNQAFAWLVWAQAAALALALSTTLALIWSDGTDEGTAKAAAACWILAVLGWVLVPVLQRSSAMAGSSPGSGAERLIASLADVDLVVTSQPRPEDLVVGGVPELAPGEHVALRLRRT
jgi:hypothetical protein